MGLAAPPHDCHPSVCGSHRLLFLSPAFSRWCQPRSFISPPLTAFSVFVPRPSALTPALPCQGPLSLGLGPMALQALQSSGVAFRKILSHFPEELSLAFAYGSGVYRQAGPSSNQKVSPTRGQPHSENRPVRRVFILPSILSEP